MMDFAAGLPEAAVLPVPAATASSLSMLPRVRPSAPTTPTWRKSRREGRHMWSLLLHHVGFHLLIIALPFLSLSRGFDRTECLLDAPNQFLFKCSASQSGFSTDFPVID